MKSEYDMKNTTLCYIENQGKYLMLHRVKKQGDVNCDKWVGIGGKLESGESPFDCARREILEETGIKIQKLNYRGIVTFVSDKYGTEYMHLFTASGIIGQINFECEEGVLEWIAKDKITTLPIWEGDKIFLDLISTDCAFFSLKLEYEGDRLVSHTLEI